MYALTNGRVVRHWYPHFSSVLESLLCTCPLTVLPMGEFGEASPAGIHRMLAVLWRYFSVTFLCGKLGHEGHLREEGLNS
jgi:hypothetical protein